MMLSFRLFLLSVAASILCISFIGCSKKSTDPPVVLEIPKLTTSDVLNIQTTAATCGGTITSDGGAAVTARGIYLSWTPGFEKHDVYPADGTGTGSFEIHVTDLTPNFLYYARAYATNSKGTGYGNVQSFRTLKIIVDSVSDIEGNIYHVVPIGSQKWLRENLRVAKYRNGDEIPKVTVDALWKNLTTGAYCFYDNQDVNGSTYGNLYNWHALNDSRALCPEGWHVPSDSEWAALGVILGGQELAGGPLKSTGTIEGGSGLWFAPNTGATNSSGFTGLPGGYRINYGNYYSMGNVGYFWSSSDTATLNAWNYVLDANNEKLTRNFNFKTNGFSVRCCKD